VDVGGFEFESRSDGEGGGFDFSAFGLGVGEVVEGFGGGRAEESRVGEVLECVGLKSGSSERVVICSKGPCRKETVSAGVQNERERNASTKREEGNSN